MSASTVLWHSGLESQLLLLNPPHHLPYIKIPHHGITSTSTLIYRVRVAAYSCIPAQGSCEGHIHHDHHHASRTCTVYCILLPCHKFPNSCTRCRPVSYRGLILDVTREGESRAENTKLMPIETTLHKKIPAISPGPRLIRRTMTMYAITRCYIHRCRSKAARLRRIRTYGALL